MDQCRQSTEGVPECALIRANALFRQMNLSHAQLESILAGAQAGVGASDLHGSVTGYLCGGGVPANGELFHALQLDIDGGEPRRRLEARLGNLVHECRAALDDTQLGFQPLLPDAERPMPERADALVEWCRGFLGGFGLAHGRQAGQLTADGDEVLRDFGTIAASELSCGENEEDERSLMEVSEFVRVGALVLHAEVNGRRGDAAHPGNDVN